ncbi:DeoR/GlpR family DNA-binding transcription regulator [Fictibacillus phosphorivorans]|uniref:DeoR/GlpR family DNA-binding transcription regulator n=1 Tax=Fictibacillus phosphorivorans TaxID=1221500 RepID=UPI00203C1D45|nr:DeoR/GlpR family DNA-binding transcription regulator [Fictibacillus phosphorivorans]MCM3719267.1 DeoR/GlpR family DNA-binding transcription regulator [Fictibacillus phosphorivorans]MCM3776889.1 DeoR/GlpR family DNA-binding transcription regulator [Fictibacillus phosphorivorans]
MFSEERREKILEVLKKEGRVLAKELSDALQVSIDSIRRDLSTLEDKGLVKRTHGGAIPVTKVKKGPIAPTERYTEGTMHENAIVKEAAKWIQAGDTLFIGGAAIHYVLLKYLPSVPLTVVTNSLKIADALREQENIDLYVIGGKVKNSGNMTDALAIQLVSHYSFDLTFVTGGGISERGISTATPEAAAFMKAVGTVSKKSIGLFTHNKIGVHAFANVGPVSNLAAVITDGESSREHLDAIKQQGVKVIIANTEKNGTEKAE